MLCDVRSKGIAEAHSQHAGRVYDFDGPDAVLCVFLKEQGNVEEGRARQEANCETGSIEDVENVVEVFILPARRGGFKGELRTVPHSRIIRPSRLLELVHDDDDGFVPNHQRQEHVK